MKSIILTLVNNIKRTNRSYQVVGRDKDELDKKCGMTQPNGNKCEGELKQ